MTSIKDWFTTKRPVATLLKYVVDIASNAIKVVIDQKVKFSRKGGPGGQQ